MQPDEHLRARDWRDRHRLTTNQLAELTGYSVEAIGWFLRGETPPQRRAKSGRAKDRTISPWVWHRWKLACAAVDHQLRTRKTFDW